MAITKDLAVIDEAKLYMIYNQWPDYFKHASRISCSIDHDQEYYDSVVFCGMGGSATPCDILNDVMYSQSRVPSMTLNGQNMPRSVNRHSLVMVNSVSGNTEEALSMMKAACQRRAEVVCISSGGKLKELSSSYGAKHIHIPTLAIPRASLPYLIMPGLRLIQPFLDDSEATTSQDKGSLERSIFDTLQKTKEQIAFEVPEEENIAKRISKFLGNGLPFAFASPSLVSVVKRFKNSLNENAKLFCFKESLMEASHNEIVPFTFNYNTDCKVLLLRWIRDEAIVNERFEKVKRLFREIGQTMMEQSSLERSLINAILSSIYILDYATLYLASSRNLDPSPTPAIDIIKKLETSQLKK